MSDLRAEATSFVRTCDADSPILSEFKVYMRYTGQGWEIPITLSEAQAMAPDAATLKQRFEEDYTKLLARTVAGMDIEITVWSVNATTPPERDAPIASATRTADAETIGTRQIFDAASSAFQTAQLIARDTMQTGAHAHGPAAVVEDETTIIVPVSRSALQQPDGCIDITAKDS